MSSNDNPLKEISWKTRRQRRNIHSLSKLYKISKYTFGHSPLTPIALLIIPKHLNQTQPALEGMVSLPFSNMNIRIWHILELTHLQIAPLFVTRK